MRLRETFIGETASRLDLGRSGKARTKIDSLGLLFGSTYLGLLLFGLNYRHLRK